MNLLKKVNPKQSAIFLFAVFYAQLANAAFGQSLLKSLTNLMMN